MYTHFVLSLYKFCQSNFLTITVFITGVSVYEFIRSPKNNSIRSPWALKKVMNRKFQEDGYGKMIQHEANILKSLCHPNIVGFRGYTTTEDGREVIDSCYISCQSFL